MPEMLEQAVVRRHIAPEQWRLLAALSVLAVLLGLVIGQERWLYLPVIALLPLLWFWPVEIAMGMLAILLPFEQIALLSQRSLTSFAFVLAVGVLCGVGFLDRKSVV